MTRLAGERAGGGLPLSGGTLTGDLTLATGARLILPPGSAAAPSLCFAGAETDGIAGVSGVAIVDNGAARVTVGSTVGLATGIPLTIAASYLQVTEGTEAAALANALRLGAVDDATKTEAYAKFGSGVRQQMAQEP